MPRRTAPNTGSIPSFLLYEDGGGEPAADPDFVHIETIEARAGLHNWEIRPHRHEVLHQFLILLSGGVRVNAEGRVQDLAAPAFVATPAGLVHGFSFTAEADGFVLTVSDRFLDQRLEPGLEPLTYPGRVTTLPLVGAADLSALQSVFAFLHEELPWRRQGQSRAVAACLDLILVALSRRIANAEQSRGSTQARWLVMRFKGMVKDHAAEGWSIDRYATALGVSLDQLKRACRSVAQRSPLQMVHDRQLAEAKRNLIYTSLTVQEIAYALGFADPAYFTRFFSRNEGQSPQQYRRSIGADASA